MALSSEEVRHIADLARLRLTDAEEVIFAQQLSAILDYAARLNQIDTEHISPTASVLPLSAPLRPDQVRKSKPRASILRNAEDSEEGMFRVPQILE
jgi:aspartyl-tRNA(Asn)/glutamyl-tRNA(Gln) amidotransferase subunit C